MRNIARADLSTHRSRISTTIRLAVPMVDVSPNRSASATICCSLSPLVIRSRGELSGARRMHASTNFFLTHSLTRTRSGACGDAPRYARWADTIALAAWSTLAVRSTTATERNCGFDGRQCGRESCPSWSTTRETCFLSDSVSLPSISAYISTSSDAKSVGRRRSTVKLRSYNFAQSKYRAR